jgi:hypothetical protein
LSRFITADGGGHRSVDRQPQFAGGTGGARYVVVDGGFLENAELVVVVRGGSGAERGLDAVAQVVEREDVAADAREVMPLSVML